MERENDIIEAGTDFEIIDENNELILSNDNGEYPFRRVDFDDYSSIVNYGSDILAKIQELSITHAEMVEKQGVADSLDDELRGISNFSQQIERSEIKKDEKKEAKGLQKGWLMVTGMFKKKEKEQLDVNHRSYQDYADDLNQIAMSIERDKDSTLKIIALDAEFTKQMKSVN